MRLLLGIAACAAASLGLAGSAAADTLYMKDGRVLRGRVDANGPAHYKLQVDHGGVTIKRDDVLVLRGGPDERTAYDTRVAAVAPGDGAAWTRLAQWCESKGLDEEARIAWQQAMVLDPTAMEPLVRLSALKVDDLVYRYVQAGEDERTAVSEQLRRHADRGIDGVRRAFAERLTLAKDHLARQGGVQGLTTKARAEFTRVRTAIERMVIGPAGASYEQQGKDSKSAHEVNYLAGRAISLAKRTNPLDATKTDPALDRHLSTLDVLAGALTAIAADNGKAAGEVAALKADLTTQLEGADLTGAIPNAHATFNASVKEHNAALWPKCSTLERQCIESINWCREIMGLRRLTIDLRLMEAARGHSNDMVAKGFFAHESPISGKRRPENRVLRAGYPVRTVGENLAQQIGAPLDGWGAMRAWIISPPHHRNMLKRDWVHIGIGVNNSHWTLNVGIPSTR